MMKLSYGLLLNMLKKAEVFLTLPRSNRKRKVSGLEKQKMKAAATPKINLENKPTYHTKAETVGIMCNEIGNSGSVFEGTGLALTDFMT